MRRSSLVDSYIGHGEERERKIERERSRNVEEIAQGLSLERRTETAVRLYLLSFVAAGTSVEQTLAFFRHFVHLRSPSGREKENRARSDPTRKTTIFCSVTDRPTVGPFKQRVCPV